MGPIAGPDYRKTPCIIIISLLRRRVATTKVKLACYANTAVVHSDTLRFKKVPPVHHSPEELRNRLIARYEIFKATFTRPKLKPTKHRFVGSSYIISDA